MYMKNHPDTLVAYVKYYGKVRGKVVTAQMTAIDTKVCLAHDTCVATEGEKTVHLVTRE